VVNVSYLGRHARVSAARGVVWEILRRDGARARVPFTAREFYERHSRELESLLKPLNPGGSIKGAVRGALQSLSKKGLVQATRRSGDITYRTSVYVSERSVLRYNYGRAMLEAQRLHLL
jgi:hypothetical protein